MPPEVEVQSLFFFFFNAPFLKVFIEFITTSHLFYGVIFSLFGGKPCGVLVP